LFFEPSTKAFPPSGPKAPKCCSRNSVSLVKHPSRGWSRGRSNVDRVYLALRGAMPSLRASAKNTGIAARSLVVPQVFNTNLFAYTNSDDSLSTYASKLAACLALTIKHCAAVIAASRTSRGRERKPLALFPSWKSISTRFSTPSK